MASRTEQVNKLYANGDIYPNHLPELARQEIMIYHRLANAEIIPRPSLHLEIKRFRTYSIHLNKWLSEETLSPRFVLNMRKLLKISRLLVGFHDFGELWFSVGDLITIDEAGIYLDIF
jgi:hypothetical protein